MNEGNIDVLWGITQRLSAPPDSILPVIFISQIKLANFSHIKIKTFVDLALNLVQMINFGAKAAPCTVEKK